MTDKSDMDETELRNEYGMPPVADLKGANNRGNIHQAVDNSVNKALPWVAFSWFLSGGSIIGLIIMALLMPRIIESEVAKGVAQSQASSSKEVASARADLSILMATVKADTTAIANTGREHARVALDKIEQTQTQLGAKGLIKVETH
jgi:hypothetical protein